VRVETCARARARARIYRGSRTDASRYRRDEYGRDTRDYRGHSSLPSLSRRLNVVGLNGDVDEGKNKRKEKKKKEKKNNERERERERERDQRVSRLSLPPPFSSAAPRECRRCRARHAGRIQQPRFDPRLVCSSGLLDKSRGLLPTERLEFIGMNACARVQLLSARGIPEEF